MEDLVSKAKFHDKEAFSQLMKLIGPSLYKIARAMLHTDEDASDAMQNTALTCWEQIHTLRKERFFKTWAIRILINHCNSMLHDRKHFSNIEEPMDPIYLENGYKSVEWMQFLKDFPEKYRILLLLYYVEGYSTREISQMLDLNVNTVKTRLKTIRDQLAKMDELKQ